MPYAVCPPDKVVQVTVDKDKIFAEAMASGVPVLAYRSAAAAELIDDGRNGVTVGPGDEAAYLAAALSLIEDGRAMRTIANEARQSILPRSWEGVVARFESVAREAVAG